MPGIACCLSAWSAWVLLDCLVRSELTLSEQETLPGLFYVATLLVRVKWDILKQETEAAN
jgi:hypothetical protein